MDIKIKMLEYGDIISIIRDVEIWTYWTVKILKYRKIEILKYKCIYYYVTFRNNKICKFLDQYIFRRLYEIEHNKWSCN